MSLLRPWRLATMLGSGRVRRLPTMSRRAPSPSHERDRSSRRTTVIEIETTEIALPGLETVEPVHPSPERGHWIQRGPEGKLMLFSGRSNVDLAERIAEKVNIELGEIGRAHV